MHHDGHTEERQSAPKDVTPAAMDVLTRYAWPGNIRELRNLTRQLVIGPAQLQALRTAGLVPQDNGARKRGQKKT